MCLLWPSIYVVSACYVVYIDTRRFVAITNSRGGYKGLGLSTCRDPKLHLNCSRTLNLTISARQSLLDFYSDSNWGFTYRLLVLICWRRVVKNSGVRGLWEATRVSRVSLPAEIKTLWLTLSFWRGQFLNQGLLEPMSFRLGKQNAL
jgi:hypothetical protein